MIHSDGQRARPQAADDRDTIAQGAGGAIALRAPRPEDGAAVNRLIAACPPLDANSLYCNLLQCSHFSGTCVLAERGGTPMGWVSGYRPPADPSEIFVWQVAVHPQARGLGLGGRMLAALLERPQAAGAALLTTTITEANAASWALFRGFARRIGAPLRSRPLFDRHRHLGGVHATEHLVSIGPFRPTQNRLTPDSKEDP